jgi:hypothetical protein
MAIAITRTSINDDDGSLLTGTVLNNAWKTEFYGQIDAVLNATRAADLLFTDATYDFGKAGATRARDGFFSRHLTVGGTLTVNGTGTHEFTSALSGGNFLGIVNTTNDTASYSALKATAGATNTYLYCLSAAYTPSTIYLAASGVLVNAGAGGLSIAATNAAGDIRFYAGGTTERVAISDAGVVTIGGKALTFGANDSGGSGFRTVTIANA